MEMRVDLKICEGCGCLWYRAQQEIRIYCVGCNQRLKEFPTTQSRKRRRKPKQGILSTVLAVYDPHPNILDEGSKTFPGLKPLPVWLPTASSIAPSYAGGAQ